MQETDENRETKQKILKKFKKLDTLLRF